MDIWKDFDTINRTPLWETLYKKGLPIDTILHIRRGRKNINLLAKTQGQYGAPPVENNVGVFRGSATGALFIIYMDDAMEDYTSLKYTNRIPIKHTPERAPKVSERHIREAIQQNYNSANATSQENG